MRAARASTKVSPALRAPSPRRLASHARPCTRRPPPALLPAGFFCSELLAHAWKHIRVLPPERPPSGYWPVDFGASASHKLRLQQGPLPPSLPPSLPGGFASPALSPHRQPPHASDSAREPPPHPSALLAIIRPLQARRSATSCQSTSGRQPSTPSSERTRRRRGSLPPSRVAWCPPARRRRCPDHQHLAALHRPVSCREPVEESSPPPPPLSSLVARGAAPTPSTRCGDDRFSAINSDDELDSESGSTAGSDDV